MASAEIELVGGVFDGARLRSGLRAALIWTNGKRCFRKPGRGRVLYRATEGRSRFVFIGNTHVMCGCGAVRGKSRTCPLCGESPATIRT